jgi:molecular chaperone DnaK
MSKEDVEKAVEDAKRFEAEDKARREEVDLRNEADQLVYQSEKLLSENEGKFDSADSENIKTAVEDLKNAVAGQDTNLIKEKKDALQSAFYAVSEKLYKQAAPEGGAPFPGSEDSAAPGSDDDVPQA